MNKHIYILVLALSLSVLANTTNACSKTIEINIDSKCQSAYWWKVIENSALAFKDGKITMIADATVIRIDKVLMT
jgi:hypothetical protein